MTVDRDDKPDDEVLGSLAGLRAWDVSQRHSRRLRRRCHVMLQAQPSVERVSWMVEGALFRRVIVPALAGAWCLAYVVEIIRCTGAIYGHFGTP